MRKPNRHRPIPQLEISPAPFSLPVLLLPLMRIKLEEERTELSKIKVTSGRRAEQKGFERLVRFHLKLIEDLTNFQPQIDSSPTARRIVEPLRRRARRADAFARAMDKHPICDDSPIRILIPTPPIREIRLYAERIRTLADSLAARSRHRKPRHTPRRESKQILKLIEFVQCMTGRRHLRSLSVLLKSACNDTGITQSRLHSLVSYYRKKPNGIFQRFLRSRTLGLVSTEE
jgi:hypothetical protein